MPWMCLKVTAEEMKGLADAALLAALAMGSVLGASALVQASWPRRSPAAAILLWQALGLAGGLAAVVDWEMASLAQPEMDLGWWLYFDMQFSDGLGMPRPSGFGSHDETIERYTEIIGRPLRDLFFYEVFAGFRFAAIFVRLAEL